MMTLKDKIKSNKFKIGVIGLGYVGLPLLLGFATRKIEIIGFDIDKKKIEMLKRGKSYIKHIKINNFHKNKRVNFTSNFGRISEVDLIILCIPTPLTHNKKPDLSYVKKTINTISPYLKERQTISLESTTYPGTTREIIYPILKKKFDVGKNFYLVYSPEREDPGRKDISLKNIPKVLGGYSDNCKKIGKQFYKKFFKKIILTKNLEIAEFTKIFENVFRAVNISLVNELKKLSQKMNINFNDVINASKTKPFGFMPFYPGPGIGGHCIPIDPLYLSWKAKKMGVKTEFIDISFKVNYEITSSISKVIKNKSKKYNIKNILILGVAYKKNIDDLRESPALKIIKDLKKMKFNVDFYDPYIKKIPKNRNYNLKKNSITLTKEKIRFYDAIILCTDHDIINYKLVYDNSKLIFDSRNKFNFESTKVFQI